MSRLVAFDRRVSLTVQRLELGHIGELALMIPGTICGVPEACTSVLLAAVPMVVEPGWLRFWLLLPQCFVYTLVFCSVVLYARLSDRWLMSPAMLPVAGANLLLTALLTPELLPVQIFFLLATVATLLATSTMKKFVGRVRPAVAEESQCLPARTVHLTRYYVAPTEAYKSFPSADSAEAAVFFGTVAVSRGGGSAWWWLAFATIPCFGRVYFHAHYVLDVVAGFSLGVGAVGGIAACLNLAGRPAILWDLIPATAAFALIKLFVRPPPKGDVARLD